MENGVCRSQSTHILPQVCATTNSFYRSTFYFIWTASHTSDSSISSSEPSSSLSSSSSLMRPYPVQREFQVSNPAEQQPIKLLQAELMCTWTPCFRDPLLDHLQPLENHMSSHSPLTTRYLSMACTRARGSIFTGPPFHCLTFVQSGCLCSWHLSWCVLKNFSAWEPL